jgi:zinc protease
MAARALSTLLMTGVAALALGAATVAAAQAPAPAAAAASRSVGELVPVEQYRLANGLRVVLHIDRSDPVVAVVLAAHVGSARETPGRTGFAHMFEHLFFLNSENLGPGGLDAMTARIGGSGANGSTWFDITDYLQTVPNDALEKMIWAEADKLGYFINTVTEPVLAKEKQVVKNEKRQSYDNQPYGHTSPVLLGALYPPGHPYSWPPIGSLADLDAATLDDVKSFYRRWYSPNNATLVLAGDFDVAQAKAWIEKYFGEIPRGPEVTEPAPAPFGLKADKRLYHEDNFAKLPQLNRAWPIVQRGHPDGKAIEVLVRVLTDGRDAPLTAVLVEEKKLTSEVWAGAQAFRLGGNLLMTVTAFDGVDLDQVDAAMAEAFQRFERDGVDPAALQRAKATLESEFFGQLSSVLGKGQLLARSSVYGEAPDQFDKELAALRAVSAEDVMRVYRTYLKGRPNVTTSFVPKGQLQLAQEGSSKANVVEEAIVQGAEAAVDPNAGGPATFARTPSSFDRTKEPPAGPAPVVKAPPIWRASLPNGMGVMGVTTDELPLAAFELSIEGGRLFDDPQKPGAANLLARMLTRGTRTKTAAEFENALKALGATVTVTAEDERILVSGQTLARNFAPTVELVREMLLEPRWDADELSLAKAAVTAEIQASRAEPGALGARVMDLVAYGEAHVLSRHSLGTERSVAALTMAELQRFHAEKLSPNLARFRVVGEVGQDAARSALARLGSEWRTQAVAAPAYPEPKAPAASKVYFYDLPGAKQSMFYFGYPALKRADADFYPATVANYILGGGGFASRLTQQLREGKGYTYGVRSAFVGERTGGAFQLQSPVRSNVTLEAAELTKSIMADYPTTFTDADLGVTKSALSKGRARSFETLSAKLNVLEAVGEYGLAEDYLARETAVLEGMTTEQLKAIAARHIRPGAMHYVVVGDAATQAKRLEALGFGPVVLMNEAVAAADR